jgi:hypothetical protein
MDWLESLCYSLGEHTGFLLGEIRPRAKAEVIVAEATVLPTPELPGSNGDSCTVPASAPQAFAESKS